ncbi:scabin-related ADP-ribosyltransferase, partial [Nocardioides luteus]|uniref:scabin-related ADP-ribosyltransferase n=1 Tax=Nocardioides luteus TaxID=1844 RepID=UPI002737BC39
GARYYDSVTGSFISPDPLLEPSEPRQLNAYAYGYQNPATSSDPSGLRVDVNGGGGGGGTVVTNVTPINWGAYFRNVWGIGKSSKPPVRTSRPATTSIPNHVAQKDAAAADRAQAFAQAAARAEAAEQRKINAAREAAAASRAKSRFFKKKRDRHEDEIRTLWHGGKVDPGVAFAEGIMPNGPNSRRGDGTLRDYVWWNRGPFVSTSKSKRQAENFSAKKDKMAPWGLQQHGWVYEIKDPGNGYDVNEIFGKESPFPYEKEIAFKNGVSPIFISGAYEYNGGTWTGNYIPNPRFGG